MKMRIIFALLLSLPLSVFAAGGGYPLDHIEGNLDDKASLQRGAKTYMNYCMGCHSLKYQRYLRTAEDLDIPEDLMLEHLVFDPDAKIGDLMENSISADNAKFWFGAPPPDLTLHSNLKGGPSWIYTYLRTFYRDDSRPFGVNNLVFDNVGMPHVLEGLQGVQVFDECMQTPKVAENGGIERDFATDEIVTVETCGKKEIIAAVHAADPTASPLKLVEGTGTMTPEEYDQLAYDLANFMYYIGEPARIDRTRIGVYVLLFLAFFYVFTWLLGREYHKAFHN